MSWILAAFNTPKKISEMARGLVDQTPSSLFIDTGHQHVFAAGGIPETCHFYRKKDHSGWIVVGIGLSYTGASCASLQQADWQKTLASPAPTLPSNGHYAGIRWDEESFEGYVDPLGIRTLYYAQTAKGLLASTRLDWLAQLTRRHDIDFDVFGAQWQAYNQITQECPIRGISRLGAGGALRVTKQAIHVTHAPWTPKAKELSADTFTETLHGFTNPRLPGKLSLSLGLSGGLDSRLLLALLDKNERTQVHSFGSSRKTDVKVACEIAQTLNLHHTVHTDPVPTPDECLALIRRQIVHTQALTPASAILGLRYFDRLGRANVGIIDGGFGEIGRRQFLNRLAWNPRSLVHRRYDQIQSFISYPKADLFTPEVKAAMDAGVARQIEKVWESIRPFHEHTSNALDLLSVRSRLPNFFGYEQNRLDGVLFSYMPFAQPAFLDVVFNLPLRERKNGRRFREAIRLKNPRLAQFPLVKGQYTYPFKYSSAAAFIWTNISAKINPIPPSPDQNTFLYALKDFVFDTLSSNEVKSYSPYNLPVIEERIQGYYAGEEHLAHYVDWWLSFEVWRQALGKTTG